jgi:hypothetical protein
MKATGAVPRLCFYTEFRQFLALQPASAEIPRFLLHLCNTVTVNETVSTFRLIYLAHCPPTNRGHYRMGQCQLRLSSTLNTITVQEGVKQRVHNIVHTQRILANNQYCTVLYCTVPYCTVMYPVQYNTVLYRTVLYRTVPYCTVQYSTVQYTTLHFSTVQYCTVL